MITVTEILIDPTSVIQINRDHTRTGQWVLQILKQDANKWWNHCLKMHRFLSERKSSVIDVPTAPHFVMSIEITQWHEGFGQFFTNCLNSPISTGRLGGR